MPATTETDRFERLFHDHKRAVLGYALRRVRADAAHDVLAETFLIAWRRRVDIPASAELPWLLGVARNVTRQHYVRSAHDDALAEELARLSALDRVAPVTDLEDDVIARMTFLKALAGLSEQEREVLILASWDNLSTRSAAAAMGCSGAAFRVRLHRARAHLSRSLVEMEGADEASGPTHTNRLATPFAKRLTDTTKPLLKGQEGE